MKIIYLAAGHAVLNNDNVTYNDYYIKRDLVCDMLVVDLAHYDILIASPPCNYYSKANYRRDKSSYSLMTKHLLPDILNKFINIDKPFIVENVINKKLMRTIIDKSNCYYFEIGRHCYFTNVFGFSSYAHQIQKPDNIANLSKKARQGGKNVNTIFERFIEYVTISKI